MNDDNKSFGKFIVLGIGIFIIAIMVVLHLK